MRLSHLFLGLISAGSAFAFECKPTVRSNNDKQDLNFDLTPLSGLREASMETETPPTVNEAKVRFSLCGDDSVPWDDKLAEEDQCPEGTKVCLTLLNHKSSSNEPSRVTAVIPIWQTDTSESDVSIKARSGEEGLNVDVTGPEYAGVPQRLRLELLCSPMTEKKEPEIVSYTDGLLTLSWSTPDACSKEGDGRGDPSDGNDSDEGRQDRDRDGGSESGGFGIGTFFKLTFWLGFIGLIGYFAIGIYYNYTTYGAKGIDLLPHKEFWEDLPRMLSDLVTHVVSGVRGRTTSGGSRGGYQSLG